jgi:hypothetical protein
MRLSIGREGYAGVMTDWKRAALRRFLWTIALAVVGLVVVVVSKSRTWDIIGWAVVAAAVTIAIGLAFLEVGYSEDRERAREKRGR